MNFQLMDKIIWWIPIKKIIIYLRKKIQDKKNHLWIKDCIDKYSLLNNTERFKIEDKNNWYISCIYNSVSDDDSVRVKTNDS